MTVVFLKAELNRNKPILIYFFTPKNKKTMGELKTYLVEFEGTKKKYCFNSKHDLKAGDRFKSPNYDSVIEVKEVCDETYSKVVINTGQMFKENEPCPFTNVYPIREVVFTEPEVVFAKLLN